jgi:hypothetical protein
MPSTTTRRWRSDCSIRKAVLGGDHASRVPITRRGLRRSLRKEFRVLPDAGRRDPQKSQRLIKGQPSPEPLLFARTSTRR